MLQRLVAAFCFGEMGGAGLDVSASSDKAPGTPVGCLRLRRTQVSKQAGKHADRAWVGFVAKVPHVRRRSRQPGFPSRARAELMSRGLLASKPRRDEQRARVIQVVDEHGRWLI